MPRRGTSLPRVKTALLRLLGRARLLRPTYRAYERLRAAPPLAFANATFDLAYALSVFTHLPEAMQHDWMDELRRVVRPGGYLLLTTHGERYLERLDAGERRQFQNGELVVRWGEAPGTNL